MTQQNDIEAKITRAFSPSHLEVVNESHKHNVPTGSETHFKLVIVSSAFEGQPLLSRHQSVHKTLSEALKSTVHALALHTYTPEEWAARQNQAPGSPPCSKK